VLAAIAALTFAFGFGNVWALGRSLGVPPLVAPLVGPAVDLSVAGLLIGIRHLSMAGVARKQLRPARILLTACGAATLALNIAGPVTAGAYAGPPSTPSDPACSSDGPKPAPACPASSTPDPATPTRHYTAARRGLPPPVKNCPQPRPGAPPQASPAGLRRDAAQADADRLHARTRTRAAAPRLPRCSARH
jgi:hypothetical protein